MIELALTDECAKLSASPEDSAAESLSVADITRRLEAAGVCYGILDDVIADAIKEVTTHHRKIEDVIVARQLDPRTGESGVVEYLIADRQVASRGDVIAKIGVATDSADGRTIYGQPIKAPQPSISEPVAGANATRVGNEIKATVYGNVSTNEDKILVTPPVAVDADNMTAFIDIYLKSTVGTPVTADMIRESLQAAGICYGFDAEGITAVVESVAESASPAMHLPIARGTPGKKGEDAYVENLVETDTLHGEMREDGSVDFHERQTIRNVAADAIICRRVPPAAGESRIDVYGLSDPPEVGDDIVVQAGENVEKRDDEFYATIDGVLKIKNNVISVLNQFTVAGDIDLESGNLHLDKGAVDIRGTVRSGFIVSAANNIKISGSVEDARLESGGDIQISGGILHAEGGGIRAVGNVIAKFAQNAKIVAGGDIVINGTAVNCDLRSGGEIIIVTGRKARLVGGHARAAKAIHVRQLGSEAEVLTHVEICPDEDVIELLNEALEKIPEENAEAALLAQLRAQKDTNRSGASISIDYKVFPGVSAKIFGVKYSFTREQHRCRISLDEDHAISVNPMVSKA